MVPKSDELIQKQKSAGGAGYVVSIYLPPIASFYGASSQKKLIQAITPTGQIIELLCQRFQVPDPQNYGLASMDGQLLSRKEVLIYIYDIRLIFRIILRMCYKSFET
jgi:hypothetical protein